MNLIQWFKNVVGKFFGTTKALPGPDQTIKVYSTLGPEFFPVKKREDDTGWDLIAPHDIVLHPDTEMVIDTGIIVDMNDLEEDIFCTVLPRSSWSSKQLHMRLTNTFPVIDRPYCGPTDTISIYLRRDRIPHMLMTSAKLGYPEQEAEFDAIRKSLNTNNYVTVVDGTQYLWSLDKPRRADDILYRKGERFAQLVFVKDGGRHVELVRGLPKNANRGGHGTSGNN